jgi:hypothetical protein
MRAGSVMAAWCSLTTGSTSTAPSLAIGREPIGMGAQGEAVLSAVVAVLEAPQLAPARGYLEV